MTQAVLQPIEILSVIAGDLNGNPIVALTIRPNPTESHKSKVTSISREQAERLRDDLNTVLASNPSVWKE